MRRHARAGTSFAAVVAFMAIFFVAPTASAAPATAPDVKPAVFIAPDLTWSTVKYGETFIYNYSADTWTVVNNDRAKALKDIDDTQAVLCSDYDTGLGKPCEDNASYTATSTVAPPDGFASCVYIQGDGGTSGSWDTVPGDPDKRVCAPVKEKEDKKVQICHRDQGSPEMKQIEISEKALDSHLSHQWGEDIYPVPEGGCPTNTTDEVAVPDFAQVPETCTTDGSATLRNTETATWEHPGVFGPGTYTEIAHPIGDAIFMPGEGVSKDGLTYTKTFTVLGKTGIQSTDPQGQCYVPRTPIVCESISDGPTATNLDPQGWNTHDTRTTGVSEFVDGGYHLQTTDTANPSSSQNKATLYRSIAPTPMALFGEPSVEFASGGTGVQPGMQVGIDRDGDGDWDGYLVGEPGSYGTGNWWVNKTGFGVPAGMGYLSFGSWADFVAANPNAMVIEVGLSLGSGVVGDWTVTSFTYGCVKYTFDYQAPPPTKIATPDIEQVPPTCEADGSATLDDTETAAWEHPGVFGPGTYTEIAHPIGDAIFMPGEGVSEDGLTYTKTFTVLGKTGIQSTNPEGACYVPPVKVVDPPKPADSPGTCKAEGTLPPVATSDEWTGEYDRSFNGPGTYYVTYTVTDEHAVFESNGQTTITYAVKVGPRTVDASCPVLAFTGTDRDMLYVAGGSGAGLIALGIAALLWSRRNKTVMVEPLNGAPIE